MRFQWKNQTYYLSICEKLLFPIASTKSVYRPELRATTEADEYSMLKVEQAFALSASNYNMTYEDDDGETTELVSEEDLTDAILYFQGGEDHLSASGGASWPGPSGRMSRKITLRILVSVDYDGPSLSDTASLVSMDEFPRTQDRSNQAYAGTELSLGSDELEDDIVTISSRDTVITASQKGSARGSRDLWTQKDTLSLSSQVLSEQNEEADPPEAVSISPTEITMSYTPPKVSSDTPVTSSPSGPSDPSSSHTCVATPVSVFERLRQEAAIQYPQLPPSFAPSGPSEGDSGDRGARWLKDQSDRAIRTMIGHLPRPSVPSAASDEDINDRASSLSFPSLRTDLPPPVGTGALETGGLALELNASGKYYFSYSSDGSSMREISSELDPAHTVAQTLGDSPAVKDAGPASQPSSSGRRTRSGPKMLEGLAPSSENDPFADPSDPSPEVLQAILQSGMSVVDGPIEVTCCSFCSEILDSFRYVCASCGERPKRTREEVVLGSLENGSREGFGDPASPSAYIGDVSQSSLLSHTWDEAHTQPIPRLRLSEEFQYRQNGYGWGGHQPSSYLDGEDGRVDISPSDPSVSAPPVASTFFGRSIHKKPSRVLGVAATFANIFGGSKSKDTGTLRRMDYESNEYSLPSLSKGKGKQPFSEAGSSVRTALGGGPLPSVTTRSPVAQAGTATRLPLSPGAEWGSSGPSRDPSQADSTSPVSSYCILPPSRTASSSSSPSTPSIDTGPGYELCPNCIGTAGVLHAENALNATLSPGTMPLTSSSTLAVPIGSPSNSSPSLSSSVTNSPGGNSFIGADPSASPSIGATGRKVLKRKALIRHAYIEKFWGEAGWQDVGT